MISNYYNGTVQMAALAAVRAVLTVQLWDRRLQQQAVMPVILMNRWDWGSSANCNATEHRLARNRLTNWKKVCLQQW